MLLAPLLFFACSAPGGHFRLKGRFRSFNQGEFYIYSPYGGRAKLDTIHVNDGRFTYETEVDDTVIYSLIFPNFSEVPVFARPGAAVKVEGDASHLKEIKVTGTDENDKMTAFRLKTNDMVPPDVLKEAAAYIRQQPASPVSYYLLNRYFIQTSQPDYGQAAELAALMLKAVPADARLVRLNQQLGSLKHATEKARLPRFQAVDTKGRLVNNNALKAEVGVIYTWATWSFESQNTQRMLRQQQKKAGNRLAMVGICLDPVVAECKRITERDSIQWPVVCDGTMWDTPLLAQLGLANVPGNLVVDKNGQVLAVNLDRNKLKDKLESLLK